VLAVIAGLAVVAFIVYGNVFAGEDGRLPAANTPEGKRARLIGNVLLAVLIVVAVFYTSSGGGIFSASNILSWAIAISVAIFFLFLSLRKKGQ
jgi:protein-S-isoprenylcysteine O-methyltransferase Ste14